MNRRIGETETRRSNEFLSRAKRPLERGGSTPLFVARSQALEIKREIRNREDACAIQNFRCNPR